MGNLPPPVSKVIQCLHDCQAPSISLYEQQESI